VPLSKRDFRHQINKQPTCMLFRYRAPLFAFVTSCVIVFASPSVPCFTGNRISYRQDQIMFGPACERCHISFDAHDSCAETLLYRPVDLLSSSYFGVQEVPILISGMGTVMCRLKKGTRSKNCVVRRFRRCAIVIERAYTSLDSIAYYASMLYGIFYSF
jgi:hypothetical protein